MKILAIIGIAAILTGTAAWAQEAPKKADGKAPTTRRANRDGRGGFGGMLTNADQYDNMIKAIASLSADQKSQLKDKCDAMVKELTEFNQDAMTRLRPAEGERPDFEKMRENFRKATDDRQKIVNEHQEKILAVLNADQKTEWEVYNLARLVKNRLTAADVTDDQKKQMETLVKDAARTLAGIKHTDTKARSEAQGKMWREIISKVLTDDQISKVVAPAFDPARMFGGQRPGGPGGAQRRRGENLP